LLVNLKSVTIGKKHTRLVQENKNLNDYYFEYSFTQTVSGFAAAPDADELKKAVFDNWGDLPDFTIVNVTQATEEQSKELREQISKEGRVLN